MPRSPRSDRLRRFAPPALVLTVSLLAACSKSPPPAPPPQPYTAQPYPQPYPAQPYPQAQPAQPALGSAMLDMIAAAQKTIPCPLPGLPPEVARLIDCAAIRTATNAVAYVPRAIAAGSLPAQVDHRAQGLTGPVKDQNPVGACSGFAMSSVMDNAIRRRGRYDVVSPLHVFATYTQPNDLGVLKGRPLAVDPVWPFDKVKACRISSPAHGGYCQSDAGVFPGSGANDPMLLSERARADSMGAYRIDALEYMEAKDIDQMALLLAEGEAVWVALAFDRQAWDWNSVRSGYLPYYPRQDGIGHAVVLQGYRTGPTGREFLFQNSWGPNWGLGGYLWIPESMMRTHLLHAYRVRVSDAAGAPYVPPSVPQAPNVPAASCPQGQTAVLGVCLPLPGGGAVPSPGAIPPPSGLPPMGNCPAGTVPNLLVPGQCVAVPSGL
ncbi:C1 family peptidase [Polyangium sp. 15x6]|uniref:C1 family peptidase n=1 Tax=Polyangium sp. 15x6 TaxID=3042687 RepID=UPI00249C13DA|nr:C1 family peptidase [Polyangium sp. 15x6]MDI3288999.1 C1 family peptidase [Polyangium sp. 15x6]